MNAFGHRTLPDLLVSRIRQLQHCKQGSVATIFALATIPIFGVVGAAVDYSHASLVRSAMQSAADATALMLAKEAVRLSPSQIQSKGSAYFNALMTRRDTTGVTANFDYSTAGGPKVVVTASADVKTNFMQLMGYSKLKVHADSVARWGNTRMRVALALDTTGSMADDGKMAALKVAAKSLLTTLKDASTTSDDVHVSIIPFSKGVNVSSIGNKNSSWLKWDGTSDSWEESNGHCSRNSRRREHPTKDHCDVARGTWEPDSRDSWNGCVMDRDQPNDVRNARPSRANSDTLIPAENSEGCPEPVIALTTDWRALNDKVDALQPRGMTNQVIGLAWAFKSLTSEPFAIPAKDPNYQYTDAIVLVTDGLNTQSRYSRAQAAIDNRERLLCSNAKAAGMVIYTLFINTGGDPSQPVLTNCASSPDKAIEVRSTGQVLSAFQAIGTSLTKLRIAQ